MESTKLYFNIYTFTYSNLQMKIIYFDYQTKIFDYNNVSVLKKLREESFYEFIDFVHIYTWDSNFDTFGLANIKKKSKHSAWQSWANCHTNESVEKKIPVMEMGREISWAHNTASQWLNQKARKVFVSAHEGQTLGGEGRMGESGEWICRANDYSA